MMLLTNFANDALFEIPRTTARRRCARLLLGVAVLQSPAFGQVPAPTEFNEPGQSDPPCLEPGCASLPDASPAPEQVPVDQPPADPPSQPANPVTRPPAPSVAEPCSCPPVAPVCPAPPEDAYKHDGWFFNYDIRYGYLWNQVDAQSGPRDEGATTIRGPVLEVGISLGGTPARGLVLGGAFRVRRTTDLRYEQGGHTWEPSDNSVGLGVATLGAFARWYPMPRRGWFVSGEAALAVLSETDELGNVIEPNPSGPMLSMAAGYEWWSSRQWSVGPAVTLDAAWLSVDERGVREDHELITAAISIQFTHH